MKRSTGVQLILLGSAVGLYGCDAPRPLQQQRYSSFEQCRRDWGDPADCRQSSATLGQPFYYFGPRYYWDSGLGRPVAVEPDGSTRGISNSHITSAGSQEGGVTTHAGSFSRGGFGSSAHSFGGTGG
jgi:hypothetical protein